MPQRTSLTGSELFIVDNSDQDWKVLRYLHDWCQISKQIDIATGYFEIGSLLSLNSEWQKVDKIRILMGDEVSQRTKQAFELGLNATKSRLDNSIENEKEKNDFLKGVPEIVEAIRTNKIECRVYRKDKFHAKAYITHARLEVVGAAGLVGSSNFTYPGLTENIELNVQITGRPVHVLQEWFEEHWETAEDISPEILKTIERHTFEYSPFDVYAKSLQEFFKGHEMTASEWELSGGSRMYSILDQYQKEGYNSLLKIANQFGGAFLCDGVGLGKTYVGLMLIERLVVYERKRVVLIVPKSAREDVWERDLKRYLRHLSGDFSNLVVINHTDLMRTGKDFQYKLDKIKEMADAVIIDEAHHFRNTGTRGEEGEIVSRYWKLFDMVEGKKLFMLTATPVNNHLLDLQHMIELFSSRKADYFKAAPLGIHSLPGHFRKLEKELEKLINPSSKEVECYITDQVEAEKILWNDDLFKTLVVQRSRAYVKQSQEQAGGQKTIFPTREIPQVAAYKLKKTYGKLLGLVETAFKKDKPLFSLAIYFPMSYYVGPDIDLQKKAFTENRQKEVVTLIRTQFLKRFESSAKAFELSCETLFVKLLAWLTKNSTTEAEKKRLDRWQNQHEQTISYVKANHKVLFQDENDVEEDLISEEILEDIVELPRSEYNVDEIIAETFLDLDQICEFLKEIQLLTPAHDDKLKTLINLLNTDPVLKVHKVIIFSEFMATARYLKKQLIEAGFKQVDEVDSATKKSRSDVIRSFAPFYNRPSQMELFEGVDKEIRILISTDVLSEGLNLQDATRLINYDLHWNPVRLMQRIGRVDRRLNPAIEEDMLKAHPEWKSIRGTVAYWNFMPPDELDELLKLYAKVSKKTLRISKIFGIEGKKLLTPQDDYDALKDFVHSYEGNTTMSEAMHLEYQKLLKDIPDLETRLSSLPLRVFSGKEHISPESKAIFFCFALPAPAYDKTETKEQDAAIWTEEAGFAKWYLYTIPDEKIIDEPGDIISLIRCIPETPRKNTIAEETLSEIRQKIEKHIKNTYLKQVQAPIGVKAILKSWMELS